MQCDFRKGVKTDTVDACLHEKLVKTEENTVCSKCGMVVNEVEYSTAGMHDSGRSRTNMYMKKMTGTRDMIPNTKDTVQLRRFYQGRDAMMDKAGRRAASILSKFSNTCEKLELSDSVSEYAWVIFKKNMQNSQFRMVAEVAFSSIFHSARKHKFPILAEDLRTAILTGFERKKLPHTTKILYRHMKYGGVGGHAGDAEWKTGHDETYYFKTVLKKLLNGRTFTKKGQAKMRDAAWALYQKIYTDGYCRLRAQRAITHAFGLYFWFKQKNDIPVDMGRQGNRYRTTKLRKVKRHIPQVLAEEESTHRRPAGNGPEPAETSWVFLRTADLRAPPYDVNIAIRSNIDRMARDIARGVPVEPVIVAVLGGGHYPVGHLDILAAHKKAGTDSVCCYVIPVNNMREMLEIHIRNARQGPINPMAMIDAIAERGEDGDAGFIPKEYFKYDREKIGAKTRDKFNEYTRELGELFDTLPPLHYLLVPLSKIPEKSQDVALKKLMNYSMTHYGFYPPDLRSLRFILDQFPRKDEAGANGA